MPSRNPLKKLEEVLKKIKTALESQKGPPRGTSVGELEYEVIALPPKGWLLKAQAVRRVLEKINFLQ